MNMERCRPGYRSMLATVLMLEPSARQMFRKLCNMKAKNMRCDTMLVRNPVTGKYEQMPDLGAWYAECDTIFGKMFVCMLRRGNNDWDLYS